MASHLSVSITASQAGATGLSSFGKPQAATGRLGGFAAILDALGGSGTESNTTVAGAVKNLLHPDSTATADPTVLSVPLAATADGDAAGTPPATAEPKLLGDVVDALTALDKDVQSGKPVDPDLLKKLKKAIDTLSNFLAAQQPATLPQAAPTPAVASPDPVAAIGGAAAVAAPGSAGDGTASDGSPVPTTGGAASATPADALKTPLLALTQKLDGLAAALGPTQPDLSAKLSQLAAALDPARLSADTEAQLGLATATAPADPRLATAINGLVNASLAPAAAAQPSLAAPVLKLPGGSTLGETAAAKPRTTGITHGAGTSTTSAAKPASAAATTADGAAKNDTGAGAGNGGAADAKAVAAAAAATQSSDSAAPAGTPTPTADATAAATAGATPAILPADAAKLVTAAYQSASTPINLSQMAFEIVRHSQQGTNHFQIRLDPADLGRVDVKLDIGSTGAVTARLTVERPETLDLLRRDAGALGQALSQAGLDGSKTNLQFSLSQNPFAGQNGGSAGSGGFAGAPAADDDAAALDPLAASSASTAYRGVASAGGVNIFV